MRSPFHRLCGVLLALRFFWSASLVSSLSDTQLEEQRTQFFVPQDVSKILLEGTQDLRAKGVHSFYFQSYFCSWSEEHQQHSCLDHTSPPVPLEKGANEYDFLHLLLNFCSESMEKLSRTGSAYQGGFTNIIECIYYQQDSILTGMLASKSSELGGGIRLHEEYYPIIEGLPPAPGCDVNWMWHLTVFEEMIYAKGGADSVLQPIFKILDASSSSPSSDMPSYFVEIRRESSESSPLGANTQLLREQGWRGLLLTSSSSGITFTQDRMHTHVATVTPENIVTLFEENGVPLEPDYVSVDMESVDVWVARSLLSSKYRPRVVSVAYNSNFPISASVTMPAHSDSPSDTNWNQFDVFWGASAGSIKLMADETGYAVVHFAGTHSIILVRSDLLREECPPPFAQFSNRVKRLNTCVLDPSRVGKWVEYAAYRDLDSGGRGGVEGLKRARLAARQQILLMTSIERSSASSLACLGLRE